MEQELIHDEVEDLQVPVCGANLSTPVEFQTNYITEIHYRIGEKIFIENAD